MYRNAYSELPNWYVPRHKTRPIATEKHTEPDHNINACPNADASLGSDFRAPRKSKAASPAARTKSPTEKPAAFSAARHSSYWVIVNSLGSGVVSRISGKYSRGRENRRSVIAAIAPNKIARTSGSFAEVFQDSRLRNCSILSVHRVPVEFQHGMAHCGDREWSVQDRGPAPAPQLLTLATV